MGMVRRRTRRRTMMVAGGMAYERGRGASQEPAPEQAYAEPPPAPPAPAAAAPPDPTQEIQSLVSLHDSGAISDEEFSAAKAKALGI